MESYIRYFVFLAIFTLFAFSSSIKIDNTKLHQDILSKSYVFIDKSKLFSKNQILLKSDIPFALNNKSILSYGYNPDLNVWIKFTLKNESKNTISKILQYDHPLTTKIIFYSPDNNYKGEQEGFFHINSNRKTINPIFNIKLEAGQTKTYYLKLSSKETLLITKLNLWDNLEFIKKESQHRLYLGLFFGAMLILIAYNFFIFFFTKDISYFYYICYVFFISFHHFFYVGLCNIYFEQDILILFAKYSAFVVAFPIISLSLFSKSFLKANQYPYWNKGLTLLTIFVTIFAVFITFSHGFKHLRSSLILVLLLYLVLFTLYAVYKKNRQAYFVLFGWIVIFIAVVLMFLSSSGIFNIYTYFPYPIEMALVLEAIIFSMALADRINILKKNEEKLKNRIIAQHKTENRRLEKKVELKTKDLQVTINEKNLLLKELNHRVKNNLQMIISLLRLQSTDNITAENIDSFLVTIQNRINSMSQLHELLYKQDNIGDIDTYEYFLILCNELRYSYDEDEKIAINLDISTNINIENSLYCGLILNELLTNSFKYAFPNEKGNINIKLTKKNKEYELIISDDGIGYEKKENDSLGTILIHSLVESQLNGNIKSFTKNGVYTKIKWKENG